MSYVSEAAVGRRHRSSTVRSTGLMSTTGVPSSASRGRTCTRVPSTASTSTWCRPIGLGRSADRVLNTPRCGLAASSRGMDDEEVSAGTIQPGQHDDVVTGLEVTKPLLHRRLELEPGGGCSFVTLLRCRSQVDQLRLDPADHPELIGDVRSRGLPASRASVAYRRSVSPNVATRACPSQLPAARRATSWRAAGDRAV